ncbi:hypothetical protein A9P82_09420 [Arachidicoccus ginsenosidimutans]|nr:hypothetical protein A9P82_09420 [Arachidicoccus sp. BS20]
MNYFSAAFFSKNFMQELVNKLVEQANLSPEQAEKSVEVVIDFVKEKFPMLSGAVDQIFGKKE